MQRGGWKAQACVYANHAGGKTWPAQPKGDDHEQAHSVRSRRRRPVDWHVVLNGQLCPTPERLNSGCRSQWTDLSDPYGGHGANTPEGNRAFWDYMARQGGR
jgi:hypothetical protein